MLGQEKAGGLRLCGAEAVRQRPGAVHGEGDSTGWRRRGSLLLKLSSLSPSKRKRHPSPLSLFQSQHALPNVGEGRGPGIVPG